jgi:hypothetical protein
MSQSSIIFGALFIGFLVYVTMKGQLKAYGAIFTGSAASTSNAMSPIAATPSPATTTTSNPSNLVTGRSDDQIGTFLTSMGLGNLLQGGGN